MKCITCGKTVESDRFCVEFNCPSCGKGRIIRCSQCKILQNPYKCISCDFEGP